MEPTPESRDEILEALTEEPRTKPELVAASSVSRSTIDRRLAELTNEGYVEPVDSSYRLTEIGRLALRERRAYRSHMETLEAAAPVLDPVAPGSVEMAFLRGATVETADSRAPWKVLETSREIVADASALSGTAPAVVPTILDSLQEGVEHGGLTCEFVMDEQLYESFDERELELVREIVEADGGRLLVTSLSDSYAIWLTNGDDGAYAGLTVYDNGGPRGVIFNDDPDAIAWAREQYRERRAAADVVWEFG
ncbi:helix-turn-helix transcriptional regulator [Natronococcus wangiae]|uniref:helix-turn-helix transcriptional regulator n=1 Tax=Natronococcus wangiae TaxID=3068275 RepID=UPI00273E1B10|nr:helix-turn-helix domain-containing protein [Natronococcus sp. AD5]